MTLLSAGLAAAQQTVAPTPSRLDPRGDNTAEYTSSIPSRPVTAGAPSAEARMIRSQVNYGHGVRLLGIPLSINSRDGHGRFFDEILLNTQGLGTTVRIGGGPHPEEPPYRFDMTWRLNDYVNPGLVSAGQESGKFARHALHHSG